jgi:hypothetical protein
MSGGDAACVTAWWPAWPWTEALSRTLEAPMQRVRWFHAVMNHRQHTLVRLRHDESQCPVDMQPASACQARDAATAVSASAQASRAREERSCPSPEPGGLRTTFACCSEDAQSPHAQTQEGKAAPRQEAQEGQAKAAGPSVHAGPAATIMIRVVPVAGCPSQPECDPTSPGDAAGVIDGNDPDCQSRSSSPVHRPCNCRSIGGGNARAPRIPHARSVFWRET